MKIAKHAMLETKDASQWHPATQDTYEMDTSKTHTYAKTTYTPFSAPRQPKNYHNPALHMT